MCLSYWQARLSTMVRFSGLGTYTSNRRPVDKLTAASIPAYSDIKSWNQLQASQKSRLTLLIVITN